MGAQLAGSAVNTYGQVQALKANSSLALQTAQADEAGYRRQTDKLLAEGRAKAAASGVDPSSGSPILAILDAVKERELNALTIRRKGIYESETLKKQIPYTILGGLLQGGAQAGTTYGAIKR